MAQCRPVLREALGGVDDDLERTPVGHQANAPVVALRQADPVQQEVGLLDVEFRPRVAEPLLEQRTLRQHRVVRRLDQPEAICTFRATIRG